MGTFRKGASRQIAGHRYSAQVKLLRNCPSAHSRSVQSQDRIIPCLTPLSTHQPCLVCAGEWTAGHRRSSRSWLGGDRRLSCGRLDGGCCSLCDDTLLWSRCHCHCLGARHRLRLALWQMDRPQSSMVAIKQALHCLAQMLQEVKAIGDLHRLRDPCRCSIGIRSCTVAADDRVSGCSLIQDSTVVAVRSGNRSITSWASRSTTTVP